MMNKDVYKILTQEKNTQISSANSEHKHSEVQRFSTSNEQWRQKTPSLSVVNKLSDVHWSVTVISRQY